MPEVIGMDHVYIAVTEMTRSEVFYDLLLVNTLGFRKSSFTLAGDPHIHYFNRHFGFVLRPARGNSIHDSYSPGLHHFCFRVESPEDVATAATQLQAAGIDATPARCLPEYAPDYVATYFADPDGIRLEITNYRAERRARHDRWDELPG